MVVRDDSKLFIFHPFYYVRRTKKCFYWSIKTTYKVSEWVSSSSYYCYCTQYRCGMSWGDYTYRSNPWVSKGLGMWKKYTTRKITMRAYLEYKWFINEWLAWRDLKRKEYQINHIAKHKEDLKNYRKEYKRKQRAKLKWLK